MITIAYNSSMNINFTSLLTCT